MSVLRRCLVACATLLLATTALGSPEERDEAARAAFAAGLEALGAQRWAEAEQHFRASIALVPKQSAMYDLAVALYKQHRPRECIRVLDDMGRAGDGPPDPAYQGNAAILREHARAELSTVRFIVSPPAAELRIDGEPAQGTGASRWLEVAPGRHLAEVSAAGYVTQRLDLITRTNADLQGTITLEPSPSPARAAIPQPSPGEGTGSTATFFRNVAPWLAIGIGGALLVAGGVTGAIALDASDELQSKCPTGKGCDPALRGARDRAVVYGHVADALLISGGVVAAGGVVWRLAVPVSPRANGGQAVGVVLSVTY